MRTEEKTFDIGNGLKLRIERDFEACTERITIEDDSYHGLVEFFDRDDAESTVLKLATLFQTHQV